MKKRNKKMQVPTPADLYPNGKLKTIPTELEQFMGMML